MSSLNVDELIAEDGVRIDPYAIQPYVRVYKNGNSRAAAASLIVTNSPALLAGFTVYSSKGSAQNIQIFDQGTVPSNGAVPLINFPVQATNIVGVSFMPWPRSMRNGIVICNSTTDTTLTLGSADTIFDVQYI